MEVSKAGVLIVNKV